MMRALYGFIFIAIGALGYAAGHEWLGLKIDHPCPNDSWIGVLSVVVGFLILDKRGGTNP